MHFEVHEFLLCLQNLLEKSAERESRQEYALAMIQCKVLKQLENLDQQKYDDEDITDDIKFLLERLGESVQDLRCSPTIAVIMNSTHGLEPRFVLSNQARWVHLCSLFPTNRVISRAWHRSGHTVCVKAITECWLSEGCNFIKWKWRRRNKQ